MSWGEAWRMVKILAKDPASQFAAELEGWDFAISREALATLDVFDLLNKINSKRTPKLHPGRPSKPEGTHEKMGNVGGRSPEEVRDILSRARRGELQAPPV